MKKLEIENSKGKWLVVDKDSLDIVSGQALVDEYGDFEYLNKITAKQASKMVDELKQSINNHVTYFNYIENYFDLSLSSIESLHSLIKSKGWHLFENPAPLLSSHRLQSESKTLYNPVIFKIK